MNTEGSLARQPPAPPTASPAGAEGWLSWEEGGHSYPGLTGIREKWAELLLGRWAQGPLPPTSWSLSSLAWPC